MEIPKITPESDFTDGMILIDKPENMTSFGVVARIRRILSQKAGKKVKVGHTGTLDPFATGLLILMCDKCTKYCQDFLKHDKVYDATLHLGKISTTGDPEGIIEDFQSLTRPIIPDTSSVLQILESFKGEQYQTPPAFSAIKINGRRAYDLARKGQEVKLEPRKITVYSLELLDYSYPTLKIRCHVSSGTYIRTLAEDIGKKLNTGAYLTTLRRLKIGNYDIKNALSLSDFNIKD